MYMAKETCDPIITEFQTYHFKVDTAGNPTDDPCEEFDHWLDALRYPMYGLFGKSTLLTSTYGVEYDEKATDNDGNFTRNPTPIEFARARGIEFDADEANNDKLGQIGTLSELEEEDEGMGGNASFLWSF